MRKVETHSKINKIIKFKNGSTVEIVETNEKFVGYPQYIQKMIAASIFQKVVDK